METTAGVTDAEMEMKASLRSATGFTSCRVGAGWRTAAWPPGVRSSPEATSTPPVNVTAATPARTYFEFMSDCMACTGLMATEILQSKGIQARTNAQVRPVRLTRG
jgi:hypothetical protein